MHLQRLVTLIAGAVGAVSTFLPWWSVMGVGITPIGGGYTDGAVIVALLVYLGVVAVSFLGDRNTELQPPFSFGVIGAGGLALLITIIKIFATPASGAGAFGVEIHLGVGIGLIISLLASIAVGANSFVLAKLKK